MSNDNPAVPPGPSREQHENKIKAFHNFLTALRAATFNGVQAPHIAALMQLLEQEYAQAVKDYENAAAQNPEWGVKVTKEPATAHA